MSQDPCWLIGKQIKDVTVPLYQGCFILEFEDGSKCTLQAYDNNYLEIENLVEPTLTSDVVPVGTNTLGEGSV